MIIGHQRYYDIIDFLGLFDIPYDIIGEYIWNKGSWSILHNVL